MDSTGQSAHAAAVWRKPGRSGTSPAACVELAPALVDETRTVWMLMPGTRTPESTPLGRFESPGGFQPFTPGPATRATAPAPASEPWRDAPVMTLDTAREQVSRAYRWARRDFRLPATYRFGLPHAEALERLTALARGGAVAGARTQGVDWPAFARLVNLDRRQSLASGMWSALAGDGVLPRLLSAARLAREVYGTDFTMEQLRTSHVLADAVRADAASVLSRPQRAPGNEVRLDDLYAVIRTLPGIGAEGEVTSEDARTLAGLVPLSGVVGIDALKNAWQAKAQALQDDATVVRSQAALAVAELEPALTVLGPDAARHRVELGARLDRLSEIATGPWRPNLHGHVEAARTTLGELEDHAGEVYSEAVATLDRRIGERLAGSSAGHPEALRERFEAVDRADGAAAVDELLGIDAEAASLETPPPDSPTAEAGAPEARSRRLPGRILFWAAETARQERGRTAPIPWGEWGHVAGVGGVRLGADRPVAEQAAASLPAGLRAVVADGLVAEFERLGSQEAGRRLTSARGLRVATPRGPVAVRLALGPLTGERGAVYRRPEDVQSVQVGARPSQALDLPQIMTPSTFTDFSDNRSVAPETGNDGPISIATGRSWLPGVGVIPTLTGQGSRSFGSYEGSVTATVQQIWHDRYAYFEVPSREEDTEAGSHWSVTFPGEDGAERTVSAPVDVLLGFAEDESPEGPPTESQVAGELPAEPAETMAQAFHSTLWRVTAIVESLVPALGPDGAAEQITRRFPDADETFRDAVHDLFTESALFAVGKHVLGHGHLSGEFRVSQDGEAWAAFRLQGRMTAFRRIDTAHGYVQQDARHLFWSGESSAMSGGVSSGLRVTAEPPAFMARRTPMRMGPLFFASLGGSVNRSLAASMGAGDWRYLGYPAQRRVYRLDFRLLTDIRSSRSAATGVVPQLMIGYVEVPEREADRFERELRRVLDGLDLDPLDDEGLVMVPADGPSLTDRTPPQGILTGRSRGASVPDMLGGFEHVIPTAMRIIGDAFGDARLATIALPLTARQRHRLERALTQRFSVVAALPYTSRLISHRMSYTRLYQAVGGRLRLTVRVRSEQGRDWSGTRLEWGRIDHYPISYSDLGATETVATQDGYRGGGHLRLGPLHLVLKGTNLTLQYTYGRSGSAALTARAGVWSSLGFVYEGPVRLFTFGTRYHVDVALTFEPEVASGGTITGMVTSAVRRVLVGAPQLQVARTIRRHEAVAGLIRYAVAEGLSPRAGGEGIPRSPSLTNELGHTVVRRQAPAGDLGALVRIDPDDQVLEVLGVPDLLQEAARLLAESGVPEGTYADTLDVTINEDQLIGRMMWGGPAVQASAVVHGGAGTDRHAVVALQGRMYAARSQAGRVRMRETDIMDSEPAVIFTRRRATSHVVSGGADLSGAAEDGGPFGGMTFRNIAGTNIDSNEVLSGRWLTQEDRDYRPHRGTMLWDLTVTSWSANAAGTWSARQSAVQVLVTGGTLTLRPAPGPPVERPADVPAMLRPGLIPLISTSDRLEWRLLPHTPDGPNPVLAMVRDVLGVVDQRLLYQEWTTANGRPAATRTGVPTSLQTILEHNALLGHRDTLLGPGLILHLARSLPGVNEQISLVLRADPVDEEDYAYVDTGPRDFALYRLNTQRRVGRRGTTAAHTVGGNTGTSRIPSAGHVVEGTYLEGVAESDFYQQHTNAQGEIFRTRDVLNVRGETHAYTGRLRISATVYRGYNPSKALQVLTLGLANQGFALVLDPNTAVPLAVAHQVDVMERVQFPAVLLPGPLENPAPAAERVHRLGSAPTPEEVLDNAGRTLFHVERATILERGVVPAGIDPFALRVLFDRSIAVFNGTAAGSTTPAAVASLMTATGVPFEAYAALLSRHQFLSSLHLTLGDPHVFPPLVREDGPATDARGDLSAQLRLYDPRSLGWVEANLTSESLHMAENDLLDAAGSTFTLSADGGVLLAPKSGNPVVPVEPSLSFGQSHDHGSTAGERLVRPIAIRRRVYYLRVRTGVLAGLAIEAANERRDIRYGSGQTRLWYAMDETLEVLVDPETALAMRMFHGATGIPTPHGRYLPDVPVAAPPPGSPEAAEELNRLRAAFAVPRYGDWYPVAGSYDPHAGGVVLTTARYDARTRRTERATEHLDAAGFAGLLRGFEGLGGRPVVLVMGGVDEAFAAEVARLSGHDLLFTTDDVRQDTAVRATRDGRPGRWRHVPARGGVPAVHGADLGRVLTGEIAPGLRGTRADDPPGTMNPDHPISWTAVRPEIDWQESSYSGGAACVEVALLRTGRPDVLSRAG